MKKKDLIREFSEETNITQKDAKFLLEELEKFIYKKVMEGEEIPFSFGKFILKETKEKEIKNALTGGNVVKVPAKKKIAFKMFKSYVAES